MNSWRRIWHFAPVLTVGIVSVIASLAAWNLTFAAETRAIEQEFAGRANNQATVLQSGIEDYWDKLYAVRALFDSSKRAVTREEFESFSNSLLDARSAILNLSWIPRVKREERTSHELAAASDGFPNYHIHAIAPDGKLVLAPERDEYFPKFYSTETRTSPVYGLDLKDGGVREAALARIRDGNVLSTSPPLLLRIGEGDRRGFWAGVPVYARGLPHETVEDRRRNLVGIVQGVFQLGVMIDTKLADVKTPVRLYLFAPNASVDDSSIYFSSRLGIESIEPRSQAQLAAGLHRTFPLSFGDVQWTLVVAPEPASLTPIRHQSSSIMLLSGLLFSCGLTSFVWMLRRNARSLSLANDKLEIGNANLNVANDKFAQQNLQFNAALSNMAESLMMFDCAGKLTISNRRVADLLRVPWEKWELPSLGMTVPQAMQLAYELTNVAQKNEPEVIARLQSILGSHKTGTIHIELTDGRTLSATCAPMNDGGFVVTLDDITERRRTENQISHLANYDSLTDLPNRVYFYEKMQEILLRAPPSGTFALLSIDLDRFKSVNDTLGHPIGDKLLQAVAERMRGCVRETDVVARLGGDEFAIIQAIFDQRANATSLATRLIEALSAAYQLDGHQVTVGTSVGIAIAPDDGMEPDQLMKRADLALYRAKADGGSLYRFFNAQMDAGKEQNRALESDLRKALANGEFALNFQPIVNLKTGKIIACEALIRWHEPERGAIPPLEFIPCAEETGLIVPIGTWVLERACSAAAEWPDDIAVAVNVSPVQFRTEDFIKIVTNALENSHLPASRLEIEITELVLIQDSNAALDLLRRLKKLGVSIAMDDFGTGHSSLGYLRSFPFDRIKIDHSFIRDLPTSKDSLVILRAVVGLGRSFGIVTTAEGVETLEQLEILRTEGCTEVQGYFFSPPKSTEEIGALLTSLAGQSKAVA